jgi:hypothetical protein
MPPHPSFISQACPPKVVKHVGDMNLITPTNWLSSGEDALIQMKVQVKKHVGDVIPILLRIPCWKNRGEGKKASLPHNFCCVVFDDFC